MFQVDVDIPLPTRTIRAAFAAPAGVCALFGPSGAGKTTIIKAIGGILTPSRGRVQIGDDVLFDAERGVDVAVPARRLGHVFQDARLFPHLSVRGNLLYARHFGGAGAGSDFDDVTSLLALGPLLGRRPATLSGGERQRVAIGRALMSNPKALLMDEPLAALDAALKADILPYLDRLCRESGIPIIYVSHAIDEVARLADTAVLVDDGQVRAVGPVEQVLVRGDLAGPAGPSAVLTGIVARHNDDYAITEILVENQTLVVPRIGHAVAAPVRLRVPARDVALALGDPGPLSVRNRLAGNIDALRPGAGHEVDITVNVGRQSVSARITRLSADELDLKQGDPVIALLKTVSVEPGGIGAGH